MSKSTGSDTGLALASGEWALEPAKAPALEGLPERRLVDQCRRGDAQAFARLVSLHEGMVYGLAARLLGDAEEARDIAQEVFLQVYRKLGRFEGRSSVKTWIYRIVVNQCRNRQRWWRRRRRERSCALDELSGAEEARLSTGDGPFELLARRERAHRVQEALLRLSFDHRAILLLREVEALGCEEIAASLGLAEGTVKSRLARAREAMRRHLVPGGAEG